jgi:hypothetical protein
MGKSMKLSEYFRALRLVVNATAGLVPAGR